MQLLATWVIVQKALRAHFEKARKISNSNSVSIRMSHDYHLRNPAHHMPAFHGAHRIGIHLVTPSYEVLRQLVDVILHSPHVGEEEIGDHAAQENAPAQPSWRARRVNCEQPHHILCFLRGVPMSSTCCFLSKPPPRDGKLGGYLVKWHSFPVLMYNLYKYTTRVN